MKTMYNFKNYIILNKKRKNKKIIEKLKKSKKIEIYGVGISNVIVRLTAFKFMTLGLEKAYDGLNEH